MSSVKWDFDRSARAVVEALNQIRADDQDQGGATLPSTSPLHLTSWVIEAKGGTSYLTHPPVLIRHDGDDSRWTEMISGEDNIEMESSQSGIELDESAAAVYSNDYITEWNFSIVFHDIWRVPTLYFSVHDIDGIPTTRDAVISILLGNTSHLNPNESIISDEQTWDFVSQEEHPVTGKPSFFLHPCQTAAKMKLILNQPKHYCPLLSWMSMILPSVGYKISPTIFQEAQKIMSMKVVQR